MERVQAKHIGVYGLIMYNDQILLIRKNRGPYTGLYDFPGGSLEFGEEVDEALRREIEEEVGGEIESKEYLSNETYVADWEHKGVAASTYHIGMYYTVSLKNPSQIKEEADGHDSDGALWLPIHEVTIHNLSPIAFKALERWRQKC